MADAIVSRIGSVNGATGTFDQDNSLFLKVFGGEVLTAFGRKTVTMGRHFVREISSGKSAQFPVSGRMSASYHTPGQELLGGTMNHAERTIVIDDLLVSSAFLANIDEAKNHYDVRSIYSKEMGEALAIQMDKHVLQVGVLAARGSAVVTGGSPGKIIGTNESGAPSSANYATDGDDLAWALFRAAEEMDSKDVPEEGRVAFVRPKQYYALVQAVNNINKDWGGKGSFSDGKILYIAGIEIIKTNNLPSTNLSAGVDVGPENQSAKYAGDFSNTTALVMHASAVGTVKLMDLAMESEYQISRQGTLMVAKYAVGHGILRTESAVEIRNAAV